MPRMWVPTAATPGDVWRTPRTSFSHAGTFGKSMRIAQTSAVGRLDPHGSRELSYISAPMGQLRAGPRTRRRPFVGCQ